MTEYKLFMHIALYGQLRPIPQSRRSRKRHNSTMTQVTVVVVVGRTDRMSISYVLGFPRFLAGLVWRRRYSPKGLGHFGVLASATFAFEPLKGLFG